MFLIFSPGPARRAAGGRLRSACRHPQSVRLWRNCPAARKSRRSASPGGPYRSIATWYCGAAWETCRNPTDRWRFVLAGSRQRRAVRGSSLLIPRSGPCPRRAGTLLPSAERARPRSAAGWPGSTRGRRRAGRLASSAAAPVRGAAGKWSSPASHCFSSARWRSVLGRPGQLVQQRPGRSGTVPAGRPAARAARRRLRSTCAASRGGTAPAGRPAPTTMSHGRQQERRHARPAAVASSAVPPPRRQQDAGTAARPAARDQRASTASPAHVRTAVGPGLGLPCRRGR